MKSAWFFGTEHWQKYLQDYAQVHPECLNEFRSSPLAEDHDFADADGYQLDTCQTQVIDLRDGIWGLGHVRKSYHSLINKAKREYDIRKYNAAAIIEYKDVHIQANGGQPRPDATYAHQAEWLKLGCGLLIGTSTAFAYWLVYDDRASYMSGPSVELSVQHAVVYVSLQILQRRGVQLVEMGQVDGPHMTEKERSTGFFKTGFGGEARPYLVAREMTGVGPAPLDLA
jgi:hypothetical protein